MELYFQITTTMISNASHILLDVTSCYMDGIKNIIDAM